MEYKANSHSDLSALSVAMCSKPDWFVLAHVHDLGLMRCRQQPLAMMISLVRRLRGTGGMLALFLNLKQRSPDVVTMWFADTLNHLHLGKDTEDTDSVGGWSQREIDLLCERIPALKEHSNET